MFVFIAKLLFPVSSALISVYHRYLGRKKRFYFCFGKSVFNRFIKKASRPLHWKNKDAAFRYYLCICLVIFSWNDLYAQTTLNITSIEDSYINQTIPATNLGSSTQLKSKPYSPGWSERFLLKVDLSSIPDDAQIISAELKLTVTNYLWVSSSIGAYRIKEDWSENSVTWSNFSNNYEGSPTDQKTCTYPSQSLGSRRQWDVLSDVQAMHSGTMSNNGWLFRDVNASSSTQAYWNFASSEHATPTKRPVLVVTFLEFDPLPVELLTFTAKCEENISIIEWETASEENSSHFKVDCSKDGSNWEEIATVNAAGFSNNQQSYSINYLPSFSEKSYYRLTQYDKNGAFEIFHDKVIEHSCAGQYENHSTIYPNPNTGEFNILFQSEDNTILGSIITIFNAHGVILYEQKIEIKPGTNIYAINASLHSGMYFVKINSGTTENKTLKLTIN